MPSHLIVGTTQLGFSKYSQTGLPESPGVAKNMDGPHKTVLFAGIDVSPFGLVSKTNVLDNPVEEEE